MSGKKYTAEDVLRILSDVITHGNPLSDVQICLKVGVDVNGIVRKGLRPLHYAAYENYASCIRMLIENGADVNLTDNTGFTPLHIAAKHGQLRALRCLLHHNAVVNFNDATQPSCSKISKALSDLTVNPLNLAIENNHADCVEALLVYGADPNQKYFLGSELTLAPLEHIECLKHLLEHGAKPDDVNRAGQTVLMKACKLNYPEAAKLLIQYGADVNVQCPPKFDQKTALHFAAMTGNEEMCRILLESGASTRIPDNYEYAALDFAITQDKPGVCRVLAEYGADVNEINGDRCSPLQVACTTVGLKHRTDITKVLLEHGANPNFHSETFSYTGPSLSPIVEYFSFNDEYDFNFVKVMLQYGSDVNFALPTKLFKIKDACGILGQIRKLRPYEDILRLLLEAANSYDIDAVNHESSLSNRQRELIVEAAQEAKSLRHICRACIRRSILLPITYEKIYSLPLPTFLKRYLHFEMSNST